MTFALARSLLLADAVTPEALGQALLASATRGTCLVRALLATRAIDAARLEALLDRNDAPTMRHVTPVAALVQHLPPGMCERLLALPVRRDPRTGTVDVAVVDARDPHPVEEMAHWLRAPVRLVRTSLAAMDTALRRMHARPPEQGPRSLAAPIWVPPTGPHLEVPRTPAYGSPAATPDDAHPDYDEAVETDVVDFPIADPNIPIPLTRRSLPPTRVVPVPAEPPRRASKAQGSRPPARPPPLPGRPASKPPPARRASSRPPPATRPSSRPPPAARLSSKPPPPSDREPVLDLRRRKSLAATAPNAPLLPFVDLAPAIAEIREAGSRDAILERVVAAVRTVARKVAVMAVRRDLLVGWTCSIEMADRATLRTARISPGLSGVLSGGLDAEEATLARIPKDATHAPLLSTLKAPPVGEVALVAIRVEGKSIALVIADELGDSLLSTKHMGEVARAAGEALTRLLREKRR